MTYPQQSADTAALNGQNVFRLNTELVSPGDIYQCTQGVNAIALGPDSDISKVVVVYFDDSLPETNMNSLRLGPDRSLSTLFQAENTQSYLPVLQSTDSENQRPGRILIYSDDLYDPSYRPAISVPADTVDFVTPKLDVMLFFKNPANVPSSRPDKVFYFPTVPFNAPNKSFLVVPYYGRKYAHISMIGPPGDEAQAGVLGVNYRPGNQLAYETVIRAISAVDELVPTNVIVTAGNQGMFDALVIVVDAATSVIPEIRITMSDTPAATPAVVP